MIKVIDVAYPILQVPGLNKQEAFLKDFGLVTTKKTSTELYMQGLGPHKFIHKTIKGKKKFIGSAFYAKSMNDLNKLSKTEDFSEVKKLKSPGGGFVVEALDPDGLKVEVIFGMKTKKFNKKDLVAEPFNSGGIGKETSPRKNQPRRVGKPRSSKIKKLGHLAINVNDPSVSFDWYNKHLGLIPSDKVELGKGSGIYVALFCRCDLGNKLTDHHSFLLQSNLSSDLKSGFNHCAYEVVEVDDIFLGHEVLKEKSYRHEWGIGRHFAGSQIFDYWRSPYGHVHEHQTDGDLFDNKVKPGVIDISEAAGMQWGPDITATFGNSEGV